MISEAEWKTQAAENAAAEARRKAEEARVVDVVRPGESQSETDHKIPAATRKPAILTGANGVHATGWFSYEVKVLPDQPQQLVATFWGVMPGTREFDVVVDGKVIATQKLDMNQPGEFFEAVFPHSAGTHARESKAVTVKLVAHPGKLAGGCLACACCGQRD